MIIYFLLSNFLSSTVQHAFFGNVALKHMLWRSDKTKIKWAWFTLSHSYCDFMLLGKRIKLEFLNIFKANFPIIIIIIISILTIIHDYIVYKVKNSKYQKQRNKNRINNQVILSLQCQIHVEIISHFRVVYMLSLRGKDHIHKSDNLND